MVVVILHTTKFGIDCISFYQPSRAYSFIGQQNHNPYGVWGRFWCIHSIHPLIWLSRTLELSSVLHYLVMRLLKNLLDSGWTVYMDNFYTSPILYTRTYCWTCQTGSILQNPFFQRRISVPPLMVAWQARCLLYFDPSQRLVSASWETSCWWKAKKL